MKGYSLLLPNHDERTVDLDSVSSSDGEEAVDDFVELPCWIEKSKRTRTFFFFSGNCSEENRVSERWSVSISTTSLTCGKRIGNLVNVRLNRTLR
jgi:hypothetical protein